MEAESIWGWGKGPDPVVLIVEADDAARDAARRMLEADGYEALTAASSVEALPIGASCPGCIELLVADPRLGVFRSGKRLPECFSIPAEPEYAFAGA